MLLFGAISQSLISKYWERITNIPSPYDNNYWLDVYFLPSNPQYGWICGFNGMVLRTTNAGSSWQGATVTGAYHLESVHFPTANIGYTSGVEGIFKSTDGGATWNNITPSGAANLWGNFFVDANNGILVGGGCDDVQNFWKTTDGGATWTVFVGNEPNSGLTDVILYDAYGTGYAVSSGKLWRTSDGGSTWEVFSTSGTNVWQEEICKNGNSFLVPYAGLNCSGQGNDGGMRFSVNNGSTWRQFQTGISMFGAFLLDANNAWACGYNRSVYYTSDGGQTWILRNCGVETGNLDDIWFINPSTGWLVGEGVYKLADDRREVSQTILDFGKLCVGDEVVKTFYVRNFSFSETNVNIQGTGNDIAEFNIIPKFTNTINVCDSLKVTVVLRPVKAGSKNARITVTFEGGATQDVLLTANVIQSTIMPDDTLLTINPAYCGISTNSGLLWRATLSDEYIDSVQLISGSNDIQCVSSLPLKVFSNGTRLLFSVTTKDTGWVKARFRIKFYPCNRDTTITVMAYGVSPIISSDTNFNTNIECFSIKDQKIFIPIKNTGNADLNIDLVELINPSTSFRKIGWSSGRNETFKIKPNDVDTLIIEFSAKQYGTFTLRIRIYNNDSTSVRGRKNPYYITIKGTFNAVEIQPKESILDFGKVCLGKDKSLTIFLKNKGNLDGELFIENTSNPYYDVFDIVFPNENKVLRYDSLPLQITFRPKEAKTYDDTLFIFNTPCFDTTRIIIKAKGVFSKIIANPNYINEIIPTSNPYTKQVKVINTGTEDVKIIDVLLSPSNPDISFTFNPNLPQLIKSGDSIIFNFEFYTDKELELNSKICFITESYCPTDTCILVNIKSISRRLSFSKNLIDYGFHKCKPQVLYDTLIITNTGLSSDTITKIEITPNSTPFRIINSPNLPFIIQGNSKYELIFEFAPQDEGLFEADAIFEAVSKPGEEITIHLKGEYRTAITYPTSLNINFGDNEECDTTKAVKIILKNDGTLIDTLQIENSFYQGFQILPLDTIFIKPKDSIEITFFANPQKFSSLGFHNWLCKFKSLVCNNEFSIECKINIIHPKIEINPQLIQFNVVWRNDSTTKFIYLTNLSQTEKIITKLEILPDNDEFEILYQLPKILKPNSIDSIPIHFTASEEGEYQGKIYIHYESICKDLDSVNIIAYVPKEKYSTKIYIDDYQAKPGDTLTISLNLEYFEPRQIEPNRIDFSISFDKWLFFPLSAYLKYNNSFLPTTFDYKEGVISLSSDSILSKNILNENGAILNIKGLILVAVPDSTPLIIKEFKIYTEKEIEYSKKDGSLKVMGFCHPTAEMKMIIAGAVLSIKNNIIQNENIEINYVLENDKSITFKIINIYGRSLFENNIRLKKNENSVNINISQLPSGTYFLIAYENDTQIWYEKILLIK